MTTLVLQEVVSSRESFTAVWLFTFECYKFRPRVQKATERGEGGKDKKNMFQFNFVKLWRKGWK